MPPSAGSYFGVLWGLFWAIFLLRTGQSFLMKFCKPSLGINYSDSQYTNKTFSQIILLCWGPFRVYWSSFWVMFLYFSFSNFSHKFFTHHFGKTLDSYYMNNTFLQPVSLFQRQFWGIFGLFWCMFFYFVIKSQYFHHEIC